MSDTKSVAVVGNCQARPLVALLREYCPGLTIHEPIVAHNARAQDAAEHLDFLASVDIVLSQPLQPTFKVEHLRSEELGPRVKQLILWPVLYFAGYNPELRYVRRPGRPTMGSPLLDYHIDSVLEAYVNGHPVPDAVAQLNDVDFCVERYSASAQKSLSELGQREIRTHVKVTPFVEANWTQLQLFHTFNHPASALLQELARQCAHFLGFPEPPVETTSREPLGRVRLPVNPAVRGELAFTPRASYRTRKFEFADDDLKFLPGFVDLDPTETVEAFYRYYDRYGDSEDLVNAVGK